MGFHIVELCTYELLNSKFYRSDSGGIVSSASSENTDIRKSRENTDSSMESLVMPDSFDINSGDDIEITIGLHTEKNRLVVWMKGSELYGFTWFDTFLDSGFKSTYMVYLERECLFCGTEVSEENISESSKVLTFYDSEVSIEELTDLSIEREDIPVDQFQEDSRVWKVSPATMRFEDMVVSYVCSSCATICENTVENISAQIPTTVMLYLL